MLFRSVPVKTVSKKHKFDDFAGQRGTVCPATVPTFFRKSLSRDSSPRLVFIILKGERGGAGRETAGGLSIVCQLVAQTGWTTDVTLVTKMLGSVILVFQNRKTKHARAEVLKIFREFSLVGRVSLSSRPLFSRASFC